MSGGRVQQVADKVLQRAKPYVPVAVKRPLKGVVPKRYHRHFDPDWHRRTIGNVPFWEYLGKLQFDYLVERGLRPEHHLLDVGCGPLRGGIRFIAYLEPGHYAGVEKNAEQLEEARRIELPRNNLVDRRPTLMVMEDFGFERLDQRFDFALAQSVFTHLSLNSIIRCLVNMDRVLVPGGRFYATYFENPDGKRNLDSIRQSSTAVSHFDRDRFHYDVASFEWACEGLDLDPKPLGEWGHPQNQRMMEFTKRG
jgi:SAM-dependent methyltransferase